jgi:D-aminoacyl-tRNA deacylase
MRAVVQRVRQAAVSVNETIVGSIDSGFVVLLGVGHGDDESHAEYLAKKIAGLRVFEDTAGKMNLSLQQVSGAVLAISQFTLYADTSKGRRPSFNHAAPPEPAQQLYERFCQCLAEYGIRVETGVFQAHMAVSLVNDGPVTIWMDTDELISNHN